MGVIYSITNPKGKRYVGQTTNYEMRIKRYRWMAIKKQRLLYNSLLKYGFNAHVFEVLEDNVSAECLNEREIFWIQKLNSFYKNNRTGGMNLNSGGNTPIWDSIRIEEFSEKFRGARNPFYGKTHSNENIKKFSENTKKQMAATSYRISRESIMKAVEIKRRPVNVYNMFGMLIGHYKSLTLAAKGINVDPTTIRDSLKDRYIIKKRFICKYAIKN